MGGRNKKFVFLYICVYCFFISDEACVILGIKVLQHVPVCCTTCVLCL